MRAMTAPARLWPFILSAQAALGVGRAVNSHGADRDLTYRRACCRIVASVRSRHRPRRRGARAVFYLGTGFGPAAGFGRSPAHRAFGARPAAAIACFEGDVWAGSR
jgi:hypothetical protein